MLDQIERKISDAEKSLERERGVVDSLASKGIRAQELAQAAHEDAEAAEQASKLLAQYADERQAEILHKIETIASTGLSQVFDEQIELKIEQVVRARRIEMDVKVRTGTLETSIMDARGGGLAAVAGFLLRTCVLLLTPGARRLLVLDEVFAHLSEDYLDRMAQFIAELCESTGTQVVLVTHQPEFSEAAHKVIRIEKVSQNTSRFVEE